VPHFGYYQPAQQTLVMDVETGTGTLVHEMVHALAPFDFPDMPAWFREGLASLYERCTIVQNHRTGHVNRPLPGLQEAARTTRLRPRPEPMTARVFAARAPPSTTPKPDGSACSSRNAAYCATTAAVSGPPARKTIRASLPPGPYPVADRSKRSSRTTSNGSGGCGTADRRRPRRRE